MNNNIKNLPYPVLGNGNDIRQILPADSVVINLSESKDTFDFSIRLKHENSDIQKLIDQGYAQYCCEVCCVRTMFRKSFLSSAPEISFKIKKKEIFYKLDIKPSVIVVRNIAAYKNALQHPDYGDVSFEMEPGDFLVLFSSYHLSIEAYSENVLSSGSIFKVFESTEREVSWADFSGDYIKLYLPSKTFSSFCKINSNKNIRNDIRACIVLPFLLNALYMYEENKHGSLRWAITIKDRISTDKKLNGYDIKDKSTVLSLVQELLDCSVEKVIDNLKKKK